MPANDKTKTPIGLAIVGCGRVGRIRGRCALEYPGTEWIGCCDIDEKKGKQLAKDLNADFFKLLKKNFSDNILIIFAKEDGNTIAAAMHVIGKNTLYGN